MTEPRDYQHFLRAGAEVKPGERPVGLRTLAALLPAPPPAARLWTQGGLLLASALLPALLWLAGKLDPLDVILLYLAEGSCYALCVLARILFTAAPSPGERPRLATALGYALWHGAVWGGLALAALACVSPKPAAVPFATWLTGFPDHFRAAAIWLPALATAMFLSLDVIRRSDYIDAYLELGPRETARYGYVYPMALAFLLVSALGLRVMLQGEALETSHGLIPPAFLALWLIGWRVALQLLNLTLPLWGRGMARFEDRFERAMTDAGRRQSS